ncbi:hypothetical protein BDF19DRAFT_442335 [Syncephalis fuscata]|nr:hypothetical protein BDF19DRAFT_442335 [Syncephalis fuscata]
MTDTMNVAGAKELNVLVLGGTGAIGSALVRELLQSKTFARVTAAGRRPVSYEGPGSERLRQVTLDYEKLLTETEAAEKQEGATTTEQSQSKLLEGYDIVFCSMGTTRKQAGSDEAFRRIDRDYVLAAAKQAKKSGTEHFLYVSSTSASPNSLFLYPRTKGEIEKGLKELDFPHLSIYQPAFLVTEKERDGPSRPLENIAVNWVMPGIAAIFGEDKTRVPVAVVARAMIRDAFNVANAASASSDVHVAEVFDNKAIIDIGTPPLEAA